MISESKSLEIRSFLAMKLANQNHYAHMGWDQLIQRLTDLVFDEFFNKNALRVVDEEIVGQIVVQEATKAGLNPSRM